MVFDLPLRSPLYKATRTASRAYAGTSAERAHVVSRGLTEAASARAHEHQGELGSDQIKP